MGAMDDFKMLDEVNHLNWCWAAVAASVGNFLKTRDGAGQPWTTAGVAQKVLGANPADVEADFDDALVAVGVDPGTRPVDPNVTNAQRAATFAAALAAGTPVCAEIQWNGVGDRIFQDGTHVVTITACDPGPSDPTVDLADPLFGRRTGVPLSQFPSRYRLVGARLVATYLPSKQ